MSDYGVYDTQAVVHHNCIYPSIGSYPNNGLESNQVKILMDFTFDLCMPKITPENWHG